MAKRITGEEFEKLVLQAEKPVLVDFYSDTCIPCKMVAGILGELEDAYEDKLEIYKVNVNYEEGLVEQYSVMAAPTLILFHNGTEQNRVKGAVKKAALEELVKEFI
jgi:thioredoxin 1